MLTVSVPDQDVADALGELPSDVRLVLWHPGEGDAPQDAKDEINLVCIPHKTGGRKVYARLAQLPNLKVIQIPSAGYEHALPITPQGVALANAAGVHDTRTAEMALTLALASQRMFPELLEAQRSHDWRGETYPPSLADRRVLIVGYGSIGSAIGARMRACEAQVLGVATAPRMAADGTLVHGVEDLPFLIPESEIVVIVTPLTDATKGLVNADFLAKMPDGALLINVGRGPVVDTDALLAELASGRLRAALDVVDPEPLPQDHPLWDAPGCIIMPHVGGMTPLTDRRYTDLVHRQINAALAGGEPVNFVGTGEWVPEPRQ
ncbi:2-hydroxyacid dehydrogenase [Demequina sp.]|uniref:2-hydroxyacid dehydrogenase n=1 Tax=Demequina sp. TaxID=2050685 RepID=UPI003D0A4592